MKAEMLDYMRDKNINYMEASDAFARMGRQPLQRTMQAVRKEVERRSYLQFRADGGRMIDIEKYTDAPLILEDYKRLREAIADVANRMDATDESYLMRVFIEDLKEMIE